VQFLERQPDRAAAAIAAFMRSLIPAGAERLVAGAGEDDHPDRTIPSSLVEGVDQFLASASAKCIVLFRPIDGNARNAFMNMKSNVGVFCHPHLH
jgi:hypothetical protein